MKEEIDIITRIIARASKGKVDITPELYNSIKELVDEYYLKEILPYPKPKQYLSECDCNHFGIGYVNSEAQRLGKLGGTVKSEAKTKAAKENGKLGGRPKKK